MSSQLIEKAITKALSSSIAFFACRRPGCNDFEFGAQTDPRFKCDSGFIIEPFIADSKHHARTIYSQLNAEELLLIETKYSDLERGITTESTSYTDYIESVEKVISAIQTDSLRKVVISRIIVEKHTHKPEYWSDLLFRLAKKYPTAFVFLFHTKETGAWIGATPEILGTYENSVFQTMALAGTRKAGTIGDWSEKDIHEQRYVTDYITEIISNERLRCEISPRFNRQAGGVEHLCNLFSLYCSIDEARKLITMLHPTPALAGLPKQQAIDIITAAEHHEREYYGGYIGTFSGNSMHCYVNLRSMKFDSCKFELFAGGGIVSDSVPTSEWQETEAKSQTLLSLLK